MEYRYRRIFHIAQGGNVKKWLNDMSSKGLMLERTEGFYTFIFRDGVSREYLYDVQLINKSRKNREKNNEYYESLKDMNIEVIDSVSEWVFFRRKSEHGDFNLECDPKMRLSYFRYKVWYIRVFTAMMLLMVLNFTHNYFQALEVAEEMQISIDKIYAEQGILLQNIAVPSPFIVAFFWVAVLFFLATVIYVELKMIELKRDIRENSGGR